MISKALDGLCSSGKGWSEKLADCLREMGCTPCKAEPDIWMRKKGDLYKCIGSYVDDLAIAAKTRKKSYNYKLKETGPITFHLRCGFYRDDDGILCMQTRKYIEKMSETYERDQAKQEISLTSRKR